MGKEILIVESDKMVQEELERIFEATDHHLFFSSNNEEALLRGKLFKPDLMIGGKHLCQTVRAEQELEKVPFIILLDMFDDLSEQERTFLRADGIISRPLNEDAILSMVDHLIHKVEEGGEEKLLSTDQPDWKSFSDIGKDKTVKEEDFSLDESWETDEEIIELVDVVEEPEPRMSIDDFALQHKEEFVGEVAPIESWETPAKEAMDIDKALVLSPEEKEEEFEEASLQLEEKIIEKKVSAEDELFEKIELEEILQKVERLKPSIEKEWLAEEEVHRMPEIIPKKIEPPPQKPDDQYGRLDEFEAALRGEVKTEPTEDTLQPLIYQETPQVAPPEAPRWSPPKEDLAEMDLQELGEEEFPEVFLEELAGELEKLKEEKLMPEKATGETEAEMISEEDLSGLLVEELQPLQRPLEVAIGPDVTAPLEMTPPLQSFAPAEEMTPIEELIQAEELKEPRVTATEVAEPPTITIEEIPPPAMRLDRKVEEVIAKGVQEMMQDFVNKVIPEMATQMIALTLDRIEQMVKEVVPDLAEKAIREEIERLQKGEKS